MLPKFTNVTIEKNSTTKKNNFWKMNINIYIKVEGFISLHKGEKREKRNTETLFITQSCLPYFCLLTVGTPVSNANM